MKRRHWFEIAEYGSLAGLVIAIVYRQLAAAPLLSTFIWLNLKNRRYLEYVTNAAIQTAVQPAYGQLNEIATTLQALSNSQNEAQATSAGVKQFASNELGKLQTRLKQELGAQALKGQTFQEQIERLSQTVENLHLHLEQQPQPFNSTEIEQKVEALNHRVEEVEQQITPLVDPAFAGWIQTLEVEVTALQQQVQTALSCQSFEEWQQKHVVPLKGMIKDLTSRVDGFNDRIGVQFVQPMKASLSALMHQLQLVKQEVEGLHTSQAALRDRSQSLDLLKEQVQTLGTKFEQISEGIQGLNPMKMALAALDRQFKGVRQQVDGLDASYATLHNQAQKLDSVEEQVQSLTAGFELFNEKVLSLEPAKSSLMALDQQFEEVKQQLDDLDASFATLHDRTRLVDQVKEQVQKLETTTQGLGDRIQVLEPMHNQVAHLIAKSARIDEIEEMIEKLFKQFEGQVGESINLHVDAINQQLQQVQRNFEYKLVSNRKESRQQLLKALDECTEHLIMVCPWLCARALNPDVTERLETLLEGGRRVDIGWGSQSDLDQVGANRERLKGLDAPRAWKYTALADLERLEGSYRQTLQLKLLGTHEKYLVCDRKFAVVGSHNFLTSGGERREREVGLYTTDPRLIDNLIQRFEEADNLEQSPAPCGVRVVSRPTTEPRQRSN